MIVMFRATNEKKISWAKNYPNTAFVAQTTEDAKTKSHFQYK